MTTWHVISLPFWGSGLFLAVVAFNIYFREFARKPGETDSQLAFQALLGVVASLILFIVAIVMWKH